MSSPLQGTVIETTDSHTIISTADGQRWSLPNEAIMGKPQLNQPVFILASTTTNTTGSEHALAQTVIEHLLTS